MSNLKKNTTTTSKAAKSSAPATKSTKASAKKSGTSAPELAPSSVATVVTIEAPPGIDERPAAPPTVIANKPVTTTITACIDVGFGNQLFIRGEGAGLSWKKGIPMICVAKDRWLSTLPESSWPIAFKFLVNDITWCIGPDFTVEPGGNATVIPEF